MKKLLLTAAIAMAGAGYASADVELIANLFEGNQNVSWENTLMIAPELFAEAEPGYYIEITFSATTDVIELKSDGQWLPGSRYTWLGEGVESYRSYLTNAGVEALKANGLELCGPDFTVTGVSLYNDGFVMPENAVWGGYFWVADWDTLEIWKTAFSNYNGEKYLVVNLSDDNGDYADYVVNVRTSWNPDGIIAENPDVEKTANYAVVDLENVNFAEMLASTDRVMIQGNPEGGNPFNFTSVVLTNTLPGEEGGDTGSMATLDIVSSTVDVYNLQGVLVKKGVNASDVLTNLPKGVYVLKDQNTCRKVVK